MSYCLVADTTSGDSEEVKVWGTSATAVIGAYMFVLADILASSRTLSQE